MTNKTRVIPLAPGQSLSDVVTPPAPPPAPHELAVFAAQAWATAQAGTTAALDPEAFGRSVARVYVAVLTRPKTD
jgi:hypothetical protein